MKGKSLISATRRAWRERRNNQFRDRAGFFGSRFDRGRARKQIVITAEKTETYVIRQEPRQVLQAFCAECNAEIAWLTMEQAVKLTGMAARKIFLFVEAGEIHAYETEEGFLLLCPNSIAPFVRL